MPFTTLSSGSKIFYTTAGDLAAPPIVFIHGLGSSQNYYFAQLQALKTTHFVLLFDTPGSAQSPVPSSPLTVASIVSDVAGLMKFVGITKPAIVVGHSLGGLLATFLALMHPSLVAGMVLLGPIYPSAALASLFSTRMKAVAEGGSVEAIFNTVPVTALGSKSTLIQQAFARELISRQTPQGYSATCGVIANLPTPDFSGYVAKPVIVLVGADDKTAPFKGCVENVATGLSADVEYLEGVGHWHALEDPDAVTAAILKLAQRLET
ncbi:Alpha/Beta hydrolase protein [Limtongia smithiae]|uniref:Alpha/Beta hydrolase protein n=1 Tax=Limtongia smithiae TaxID=1125753 RepID=UPI0034CE3661